MRLWIDDQRNPIHFNPAGQNWHWVKSVSEAIRVLATSPIRFTTISIDHDIAHVTETVMIGDTEVATKTISCLEDYTGVAYYILGMSKDRLPDEVIIHTGNPTGYERLAEILRTLPSLQIKRRNL